VRRAPLGAARRRSRRPRLQRGPGCRDRPRALRRRQRVSAAGAKTRAACVGACRSKILVALIRPMRPICCFVNLNLLGAAHTAQLQRGPFAAQQGARRTPPPAPACIAALGIPALPPIIQHAPTPCPLAQAPRPRPPPHPRPGRLRPPPRPRRLPSAPPSYVPNAGDRPARERLEYKLRFLGRLRDKMDELSAQGKQVRLRTYIVCTCIYIVPVYIYCTCIYIVPMYI
jgi:hypothetical protein